MEIQATIQPLLEALVEEIAKVYTGQTAGLVTTNVHAGTVRKHLASYNFQSPVALEKLMADVVRMMREWNIQMTHPRYFGLYNPAPTLTSVIADTLVALYNPQLASWSHAPAANEIEKHTLHFIADKLSFPSETLAANFTSGGSEANFTAMLAALAYQFPEYLEKGLMHLNTQPVFYVSEYAHNSFDKICKHVGIGAQAMRVIPVDNTLKMDTAFLRQQIEKDKKQACTPFMVIGTAGTTSTGVIDPLEEMAHICRQQDIWYHIDAAWAGAIVVSEKLKPLLQGIEQADSITMDAHKWFSVPFGAGMFFCRHKNVVLKVFSVRADYMPKPQEDTLDPYTSTIQWTRRFMGLKLFMSLAEKSEYGMAMMLEQQTAIGDYLRAQLIHKGWHVVNQTSLPVICFTHPVIAHCLITVDEILAQLYKEGKVWISGISLKNQGKAFRACITHFNSSEKDIDFLVDELEKVIHQKIN